MRPGPQPRPGAMPPGSTMAAIVERGRLVVGVDQGTNLFGSRNPATGELEGFDIDLAREFARSIFGDPNRVDLRVVTAAERETALQEGQVDLVVRTYSITCDRKNQVAFSTPYYYAEAAHPRRQGLGNPFCRRPFRQAGVRGQGYHVAVGAVRADPRPDAVRREPTGPTAW